MALSANNDAGAWAPGDRLAPSAYFTLFVLTLGNLLNYLDRSIMGILAQAMKADLKLDDAQLGFLLGTAFAVFYSVVGIAMGRISDFLPRKLVMACGMAIWSVMTAFGGAANGFLLLATARIGVGVGEAVANPCSHSLLSDIFPPQRRALALATYLTGTFLGGTLAMILGGYLVGHWSDVCAGLPFAVACTIPGWKAALIAVGLPGLPLVLMVLAIREPARARVGGLQSGGVILREFASAFPPFTLLRVSQLGGRAALLRNLGLAALVSAVAGLLVLLTGDKAQWIAFALGTYAVVTWGQVQSHGDKPLYRLTFGDPTFIMCVATTALIACIIGALNVWAAPFAIRSFGLSPARVGLGLGLIYMVGAMIGVVLGGWLTDRWKAKDLRAPLAVTAITLVGIIPSGIVMISAPSQQIFFAGYFLLSLFSALWSGGVAALIQDLVLPRMRGAAAACYSLVAIVISAGLGPYWAGKVSTVTGSLNLGLYSVMLLALPAGVLLVLAMRRLPFETTERRRAMAEAAAE